MPLTQVNNDIDVTGVSPNVVPDGVVVRLREIATFLDTHAGHQSVQVVVKSIVGARPEVALVVNVSVRIQSGKADDGAVESTRRHCLVQACEHSLHHGNTIEFVSVNGSRDREFAARVQRAVGASRHEDWNKVIQSTLSLSRRNPVTRDSVCGHIGNVQS